LLGSILAKSVVPGSGKSAGRRRAPWSGGRTARILDIAQMYLAEDDRISAAEEVRLYLRCGEKAYRADAERWLAQILKN
jgi:hypothetical protein